MPFARYSSLLFEITAARLGPVWSAAIAGDDRERAFRALEVAILFSLRRAVRNVALSDRSGADSFDIRQSGVSLDLPLDAHARVTGVGRVRPARYQSPKTAIAGGCMKTQKQASGSRNWVYQNHSRPYDRCLWAVLRGRLLLHVCNQHFQGRFHTSSLHSSHSGCLATALHQAAPHSSQPRINQQRIIDGFERLIRRFSFRKPPPQKVQPLLEPAGA